MNPIICDSIRNKQLLKFDYDNCLRIVEPHTYGLSTAGNEVLRAYQTGGQSTSHKIPDWRLFEVSKMESLVLLEESFPSARDEYSKGDTDMSTIFCEL